MILAAVFKLYAYSLESEQFVFMNWNLGHFLHHAWFWFSMPLPAQAVHANTQLWCQEATFQSSDNPAGELLVTIPPLPSPLPLPPSPPSPFPPPPPRASCFHPLHSSCLPRETNAYIYAFAFPVVVGFELDSVPVAESSAFSEYFPSKPRHAWQPGSGGLPRLRLRAVGGRRAGICKHLHIHNRLAAVCGPACSPLPPVLFVRVTNTNTDNEISWCQPERPTHLLEGTWGKC